MKLLRVTMACGFGAVIATMLRGTPASGDEFFPIVPPDVEVSLYAREPLVRNPCAITFDARGRLCVGMGPQYRNPRPETPGDSVYILFDDDGDGVADRRKEFATGFNSIQGLAWKGDELWIANSPDLTVVRDTDGDDEADEYIRLYTDLGNLEHALHGLNWGPDGRLYMSKGNSKGLNQPPDRIAPKAFRELWGIDRPDLPEIPKARAFSKGEYKHNYHDPEDDWGREGGILRCDRSGNHLEIIARGFRNPWDIAFDDGFNWLGTDNDQTQGDKILAPFYGAHFGWGHPWSYNWSGINHPPTVPASGPLFEGSGAGITFCSVDRYPASYKNVFLINDWLLRRVYIYRPLWDGALRVPQSTNFDLFASAGTGRTMAVSEGRKFDPVDIELGPDEAIYISSWGREYGASSVNGELRNEGRIYRLWPKEAPPIKAAIPAEPITRWPVSLLIERLGSHLPVWRIDAQEELVRREAQAELMAALKTPSIRERQQTWIAWTLGRIARQSATNENELNRLFGNLAADRATPLNLRIQSIRILALQNRPSPALGPLLRDGEPRVRLEAVLGIRQVHAKEFARELIALAATEQDRIVYYAAWGAIGELLTAAERKEMLVHAESGVRRAAVLSCLEKDELSRETLESLAHDPDTEIARWARRRLDMKAQVVIRGRPLPGLTRGLPGQPPKKELVTKALARLGTANAKRGRELFQADNGPGCKACHQLGNVGNTFAPDLSSIRERASAPFIVESIVDPGAAITEGFVTHIVETKEGEEFSGILLEETGAALKLALANGEPVTFPRALVARHATSQTSPMPSNYGDLLDAQAIADLTAFLLNGQDEPKQFSLKLNTNSVEILAAKVSIGTYLFSHPDLTRPALVNVRTRTGTPVTREFPAPVDADHRWMHPGIATSFGWLDGHDYWRLKAPTKHVRFLAEPVARDAKVSWTARNDYLADDGQAVVCSEEVTYELSSTEDGLLWRIQSDFFNKDRDFYFGDQEESGLCIRIAPAFSVKGNGTILNDRGEKNEAGTWGREFQWIDYSGLTPGGNRAGILIIPDSGNTRPCWSHSRDYGVLVANPFPRQPSERREPFQKTKVPKGERFHLGFTLLVYEKGSK